ncbi:MAG: type II toxin-antitoxin system HicA family toxin [Cyclobacteriaceae bacterium]|nr:type II toxin-antitoxin system HicA family toxin [Cyclobacteriaceae bacterium]MBX2955128.1 type II toxin-antitoxin system HicA family toxin [Cyclobacteriaceae bacterium]
MGKIGKFSGTDICKILTRHGFTEIRQKGSHIMMQKKLEKSTITVPVPNHKEIKIGTLMSIIRQSGVPRIEFES